MQALWTKSSSNIFWVLRLIDRTSKWVRWLESCEKRGTTPVALIQVVAHETNPAEGEGESSYDLSNANSVSNAGGGGYESGQSSGAVGEDEYTGEADADEEDGHLQNEMEDEDTDGRSSYDDESHEADEEEVSTPASWNQHFSSAMIVNDGHDSVWQYHQNNIAKGARFPDKKHLQDAIVAWAMSTQRVFKTTVSSQKYLTMECEQIDCPGRVHGYVPKYDTDWVVSDLVLHTCVIPSIPQDHRNPSSTLLARLLYTEIVESKAMEVKAIMHKVRVRFKYNISYGKAWRAKQRALEERFGSFFDSYDYVVRLLHTLQARNPGTYVGIQHFLHPEYPTVRVLQRQFFTFGVCVQAFHHCRPVLCVDETFLTGKYRGQILTAIGQDGNNQIVPLAFAFVEGENTES